MKNYTITEDPLYKNFIKSRPGLSQATKENYNFVFTKFCDATKKPLNEMIETCIEEQSKVIEKIKTTSTDDEGNTIIEKQIIKFDVNKPDSHINICLDKFIEYCKQKGNKNSTINSNIEVIAIFLKYYNVEMPEINKLQNDSSSWYPLLKEDIKFIMSDSTLTHQTLISTLKSSGMRLKDAVDLVIGDLMDGTRDYHNFTNVDDFINHAPSGMICTFEFYPHKTKRFELPCITCIDPETTDLILQNLRRIKNEYLPRINKKYGLNLNLSKEDALFGNQREYFKGPISTHSLSDVFNKKNKKLREHRINQIKEKIEKGEIAEEDFEKEVEKIPKFHAHGLRKFFHTVIAKNCGNLRICAVMEGHTAPLRTDNSYVKIDAKEIKEVYMSAIEDLSLENTEVKIYTSEIRREMEEKINSLENMNAGLQSEIDKMDEIMARLEKLENKS